MGWPYTEEPDPLVCDDVHYLQAKGPFPYWYGKIPLTMMDYATVCKANGIRVVRCPLTEQSKVGVSP